MPRRGNRRPGGRGYRGARRAGGRGSGAQHLTEYMTFSLQVGTSVKITVAQLNLPGNRNFQPISIHVTCQTAHSKSANDQTPQAFEPAAAQVTLRSTEIEYCAASPPVVLGLQPRTIRCNWPRSSRLWWPYNEAKTSTLVDLNIICLSGDYVAKSSYVQGVISLRYRLGPEVLSSTCPIYPHLTSWAGPMVNGIAYDLVNSATPSVAPAPSESSFVVDMSFMDE